MYTFFFDFHFYFDFQTVYVDYYFFLLLYLLSINKYIEYKYNFLAYILQNAINKYVFVNNLCEQVKQFLNIYILLEKGSKVLTKNKLFKKKKNL